MACMCMCMYVHVHLSLACMYVHYVCIYACACACIRMYVYVCICMDIRIHVHRMYYIDGLRCPYAYICAVALHGIRERHSYTITLIRCVVFSHAIHGSFTGKSKLVVRMRVRRFQSLSDAR